MKLKLLPSNHLERLVSNGKPVYVINTSSLNSGDKGTIVVNFVDGNRRFCFKMPPTYIPMAVTDAIPSSQLINSPDFKQCLIKGMLTLVDPVSAEIFLSTEDAQEEYESLVLSEHSARANNINIENEMSKRTKVAHHSTGSIAGPMESPGAGDTVSPKVRGLMESLISETTTAIEVLRELRRRQSALNAVDFSYVIANSADKELTGWARKALSKASVSEEEEYEEYEEYDETEVKPKTKKAKKVKKAEKVKKTKSEKEASFDFSDDSSSMTPEERRADEAARSAALSQQATRGESRIQDEINKIMQGNV